MKTIIADFETSLASSVSIGDTTAILQNNVDSDSVTIPNGDYYFTIDNSSSGKEHIQGTLSGKNLSNIYSVSRQGVKTAGFVREHRITASVKITDFAYILDHNSVLAGTDSLDSTSPMKYDTHPTFTADEQVIDKKYADDLVIAGGADASSTVKGISKLSVNPVSSTDPIAVGDNDSRVPTADEAAALAGTSGTPSATNPFVTNDDTAENTASKIVRRKSDSNITVPITPTATTDATSKDYVDTGVGASINGAKVFYGNHDMSTTGTQVLAHGLGKIPKIVRIYAASVAGKASSSNGVFDGSTSYNTYRGYNNGLYHAGTSGNIIYIWSDVTGAYSYASISVDATNITLTWTNIGSPTGYIYFTVEVN